MISGRRQRASLSLSLWSAYGDLGRSGRTQRAAQGELCGPVGRPYGGEPKGRRKRPSRSQKWSQAASEGKNSERARRAKWGPFCRLSTWLVVPRLPLAWRPAGCLCVCAFEAFSSGWRRLNCWPSITLVKNTREIPPVESASNLAAPFGASLPANKSGGPFGRPFQILARPSAASWRPGSSIGAWKAPRQTSCGLAAAQNRPGVEN